MLKNFLYIYIYDFKKDYTMFLIELCNDEDSKYCNFIYKRHKY